MRSIEEIKNKAWKERKDIPAIDTGSVLNTSFKLFDQYREATKPKVTGGTVNPTISYGNVRENPVLKRKKNTAKTYSQALEESRNRAKTLEMGAKLPTVIPPKGDVSKLILPDTGGGGTVNPTLKRNEVRTNYDYMTDKEAAVYKYYRDRGQVEKAQEYLDALEMDVNQRAAMQKREDAKKLAEESTAAALYARAVGNIGQAAGAVYAAAMEGADKPVDPYHPLMGGVNMNEGLYEGLMGESTGANKVVKDIGLGIFDWGTQAAVLGPATPYVMAAGAAAGNTKDALERGGTTDEAVMYGLAGGAAEAITEKLGYDRLFKYGANAIAKKLGHAGLFELSEKIADKGALAKFLWEVMPHGVSEGLEEATSEFTNIVADTLVLGDNSQMKQIAQTAMENGATESEAVKTALQQGFLQVIYSGAIGAASGGVIAGGIGGLSRAKGRNALEMAGNPAGVAREAMTNAGKEVTKRINDMRSQGKAEVPEGTTQGNVLPEQGNVMGNSENVPEVTQQNKALRDFGEKYYYTEGQKVVNEEAERRGNTSFIPAFQTYYTAGLTGVKESDIKQTAETIVADKGLLSAAYLAGVNDRKADLEARMKGTGKMGQTAGVFLETDAVTKEQRSLAELVSRVAELEVVLVDELPQDRRGYYENNKGRVTIALNSGQFAGTLFHEATHYLREANPEGYDRMQQAVFSAAAARKGMDTDAYIRKYEKRYGEAYRSVGQEVNYNVILEEMTADAFAEIAGDEKSLRAFVTEMQRENPSVLEKIKEFLENLLETLRGLVDDGRFSSFGAEIRKDIKATERMAKMLAEEMKTAGEKQREESNGKGKDVKSEKKFSKKIGGVFPEINVTIEDFKQMGISEKSLNNLKVITEKERRKEKVNLNREKAVFAENLNEMAKRYGVRFSLKEPVEETKDLIAVHNMNAEDLKRTLQLGGMPMPSIAIVKGKIGHENFGEISLVFGKDTIDPEGMKENRVYGADAWTPTVPQIDYEVDSKKAKAFENEVGEKASRFADGIFSSYSVLRSIGVDESTRKTENEVAKELAGQDAVIAAYLEEQGKAMEPVYEYKEKPYDRHGNDALRAYIQKKGTDELRKLVQDMESGAVDWMEAVQGEMDRYREAIEPELRKRAQGFFKSRPAEAVEKKVTERLKKEMVPNRVREFIEHAWELQSKPAETEGQVDRNATREKMRKMVDAEAVGKWVKEKTKGMLGEAGIYNGKDPYTPSGKQRTFAQLHYAYTLENLVKAMKGNQQEKGEGLWGATARGLQAVTSREYGSIAEIRGDKGRLKQLDEGEYKAELEAIDREIESIVSEIKKTNKAHSDNTYTESDIIGAVMLEAAQGRYTKAAIKKAFANNDYDISDMVAGKILNVFESVMELPTTYFEAKPQRAVMVDEIRAAIVPDDLGADVVEQMEKAGVPVLTYEAGNEESRKEALNSVEGVRFSIREEEYEDLVEKNEALQEANEALRRQFEITKDAVHDPVSAKKAVRKWLKAHDSEYDVEDFTEKFVALANYIANNGDRVDMQRVMGALQKLAYDALSESKVLNTDLSDAYKDFKDDVRKTKIKVTEDMAEEFDYYGGYNTVRKENFGKINLSRQGGIYADVFYQEMAEKYPELLDVERVSTQVDAVMDILEVVESLQPIYENPYGMNLDEYAMDAAYDLWEMYFDIELQKPTFADRYEKKLEKEKARARAARENLRKDLKERYDEKLQQAKEDQKKKLEDARLAAAMHEGRALVKQRRAIYEKLKARDKERRDRAEYAKYKNIIEKEAALLKRWVERPTDQYHVQESMMEGVRNFLEKMKFDDPDLNIMPTDIRRMMKDYQAMTAENTMLYAEEDENVQAMLESLADRVGDGVKVSELGPTEMRQLSVVIRSVSHLVRNANKMVSIKNGQKISTIGNAYMDDVQNKKTKNPDSRLRVLSDMMNVQMLDTESFFKEMGKTVHDTIYRGLREGFDRKILHVKEASEFMQKTVDKKKIREWGEMEPKEYTLSGGKILLTDAQIMSLYCLMRRTQARGHVFGGGIKGEPVVHKVRGQRKIVKNTEPVEVTAADVTKLMSNLTEEQKKAALEIQGYLESVASWGNEVTMNMLGYKKFTETNYFPIVTDENYINTMYGARGEKNSTLQTMGITKQTNREAKNPIILENIFDAYVRHIDQMSSYNAFVPALSDLNKFMNYREMVRVVDGKKFGENRSVKETMQRVMGPAGDKYVRDLMERLNNPAVKEDVERLPRIFLRNMKIASVGANLRVIIQQPVSYLRAADEIGVGYLMGALVPSKTDFEKVYEYAPIAQWKEWGNYEMNVGRTMKELLIGQNFYESFLEKSMIAAGVMDKLTWGRIWRAAELEVKKKHPELTGNRYYETVGKRFSEIIDGTQVVDSILHRNQMMRSQSLFSQMATSFMSEPTKTYNMMRNSMVAVMKDNTPENRKKVVRTFMTLVANGVCVAAAAGLVDMLRDDDDDETLLEKWLQAFRGDFSEAESVSDYILAAIGSNLGNSFNPLGYIPYMRDIFSVIQGYTVQRTDISWLNDLVKSGKNLMRYMEGDSNYTLNAVLMDAAGSLSKATGIPINSAKRDIMAIKNTIVNYTLGLDAQYENQKLTYDVGSEKNISMYVKMMLEAKMSGNEQIATRIYNDMVNGGISNEKIDNKIKTEQVKAIKEEPEAMEAAKAYNEGRVDDYTRNVEALAKKGYFMANIESAVESLTKPPTEEDEETFETITKDYWKEGQADEPADYALLFNAYMNGNMADYEKMWAILNAAGKEDNSIRSSMRSRLKSEYWKAKEAGDSQRMQRAAEEFYRLGGKRETLEKAPQ